MEKHIDQQIDFVSAAYADKKTQNLTNATLEVFKQTKILKDTAHQWRNVKEELSQGRMFEILEVMKFNRNAAIQNASARAQTTASIAGQQTAPADIIIKNGKKVIEVQAKSCGSAAKSLHSLANPLYETMDRLLPKEQLDKAVELARQRIESGTLKAQEYLSALPKLKGGLSVGSVSSGGTTRAESLDAFRSPLTTKLKYDASALGKETHGAGLEGGKLSGAITGTVSSARGVFSLIKGDGEVGAVIAEVTVDTAKGFASGYATSALGKGVGHVAKDVGLGGLAKCNAHTAIAAGIIQSGKSFVRYLNGDIDEEQMLEEVSHTVITGTSSFYYGALGQVLIPIPVVGALVGSTVGYFVGNILYQSGLLSLGDTVGVKLAKERRKRIEALCLQAIPLMQQNRLELQSLINQHISEQREMFDSAFMCMDDALVNWNPDAFTFHLEKVCNAFNTGLPFSNFKEFDEFMNDDSTVFEF